MNKFKKMLKEKQIRLNHLIECGICYKLKGYNNYGNCLTCGVDLLFNDYE